MFATAQVLELKKLHKAASVRVELLEHVMAGEGGLADTGQLLRKIRQRFDK